MNSESLEGKRTLAWLIVAAAGVRAAFGIIMAIDAWLKWQPAFAAHYVGYLQNAMKGQPLWLAPWFNFWLRLVIQHTDFFVLATRLIETAIAIGLLLGLARRITYISGALFSFLIWSTAEGFGGPYTSGASLGSATATKASPPTPENAAAAVSPLSIASTAPVAHPAPARLQPLIGTPVTAYP